MAKHSSEFNSLNDDKKLIVAETNSQKSKFSNVINTNLNHNQSLDSPQFQPDNNKLSTNQLNVSEAMKNSKFGRLSFKYSGIMEVSQEHYEFSEEPPNFAKDEENRSISDESDDLYNMKAKILKKFTFADIPESLINEDCQNRLKVPEFWASIREGWISQRVENYGSLRLNLEECNRSEDENSVSDKYNSNMFLHPILEEPGNEDDFIRKRTDVLELLNKVNYHPANNNQDFLCIEESK